MYPFTSISRLFANITRDLLGISKFSVFFTAHKSFNNIFTGLTSTFMYESARFQPGQSCLPDGLPVASNPKKTTYL